MTDETKTEKVEAEQVQQDVSEQQQDEVFDKERAMRTIENLREIEKEKRKIEKELAALKAADAERKQAEMTELEKAQQRIKELESQNRALTIKQLRREAAEKVGLPIAFADRLNGETPEELEADAKEFLNSLPKPKAPVPISATNPGGGTQKSETDAEKRARILGRSVDPWGGSKKVEVQE